MTTEYVFKTTPYAHQLRVWEETKSKRFWAYFMEMGTGKTWIAINTFGWLFWRKAIDAVVVIAKKGDYANWQKYEIPAHLPDFVRRNVVLYSNVEKHKPDYKKRWMNCLKTDPSRLPILVINIESLQHGGGDVMKEFYKAHKRVCLIVDESTSIKHYESKRSIETTYWASRSMVRRIMTGTAVTQSPMDLWGQCLALHEGILGHNSYHSFKGAYCILVDTYGAGKRIFKAIEGYKNLDHLTSRLDSFSHRVLKKECLDLPDKVYTQRVIELTDEQRKLYETLKHEAMIEFEGREIEVVNVLALMTKLHQIICGQLKIGEDYVSIKNNRVSALIELLEDFDGKAIVWANYRQNLVDIIEALTLKFGEGTAVGYYGAVNERDRAANVESFKHGAARFMVANPQSGGYGNTWIEATMSVYYSNSYNLEHRLQSEDRNHRIGQKNKVTYVDFVVPDTVDERIMDVLRSKKKMSDIIMGRPLSWLL